MHGKFFISLLAILSLIFLVPPAAHAQSDRVMPPPDDPRDFPFRRLPPPQRFRLPPGTVVLSQMSRAAGMIFSGRVTAIARVPAGSEAIETVAITFQVEHAVRGVKAKKKLTIVQWAGLWSQGQHYQIGERVLLFLYPPSRLGLTSSVGGPLGRFSVDSAGQVLLSQLHSSAFAADPVLGGKSRLTFSDFAQNVRRASGENERLR